MGGQDWEPFAALGGLGAGVEMTGRALPWQWEAAGSGEEQALRGAGGRRAGGPGLGAGAEGQGPSAPSLIPAPRRGAGNWFQMVSAQERLTRTFTRSSHTYTRTERTEISKTRGGETTREVRVEESTQVGGAPFHNVFGDFLGRESLGSFGSIARPQEGACPARGKEPQTVEQ